MKQYTKLVEDILDNGYQTDDRTGVGTRAVFGTMARWDLQKGFPATTVKRLAYRAVVGELLWFLEGGSSVERLRIRTHGEGVQKPTIWDANFEAQGRALGYTDGELGPVYGAQWRNFNGTKDKKGVDQLTKVIESIKNTPTDRRQLVTAWNPAQLHEMALPPCHLMFQFNVRGEFLDVMWYQRSVDVFLGLPFDIASYATLLTIVAKMTGKKPGHLVYFGGNTHIYNNHVEQCEEMLRREPRDLPQLAINFPDKFESWNTVDQLEWLSDKAKVEDFVLENYNPWPTIKAPMAV